MHSNLIKYMAVTALLQLGRTFQKLVGFEALCALVHLVYPLQKKQQQDELMDLIRRFPRAVGKSSLLEEFKKFVGFR